ncbi:MAG: OB-fold domain-containing protein, partial [Dehalococcoidia bacterium]|nr:OB-fold domain-containing protein [Dehalococcoidia bacterium]
SGEPALRGVQCARCGALSFPAQDYGCIRCGAHGAALQHREIRTNGTLLTFAVVRTHPSHAVPFTLGDVQLDAGPVVRAQIADRMPLTVGLRVQASVVSDERGGHLEFVEEATP